MQLAEHYPPSAADSSRAATELGVLLSKLVALWTELADLAARLLMGIPFVVFGLNGCFNFIRPPPTPLPAGAAAFAEALVASGYMMPLIGATQLLVGVLLVVNRYVPLALILIAPFLVNAVAFRVFLEPSGLVMVATFAALEAYLAWAYRRAYAPLFVVRVSPD